MTDLRDTGTEHPPMLELRVLACGHEVAVYGGTSCVLCAQCRWFTYWLPKKVVVA